MPNTKYVNLYEVNELQTKIMQFIDEWVHQEKSPVPQKEIIIKMSSIGTKNFTTVNAINSLLRKGYIRRAVTISNKTFYVMLRRISSDLY